MTRQVAGYTLRRTIVGWLLSVGKGYYIRKPLDRDIAIGHATANDRNKWMAYRIGDPPIGCYKTLNQAVLECIDHSNNEQIGLIGKALRWFDAITR
jgi:hypothetical protein